MIAGEAGHSVRNKAGKQLLNDIRYLQVDECDILGAERHTGDIVPPARMTERAASTTSRK